MNDVEWIETYKTDLQRYSMEQLRHISAPGVWSLGQMYNHLILAALDYMDQAENCAVANVEQGREKSDFGQRLFANGEFPPIKIRLPDGPENSPSNSDRKEELMRGLDLVMQRLNEWEGRLAAADPERKVKHDGFGWLHAREWVSLVGMHFRHHERQKRELEWGAGVYYEK